MNIIKATKKISLILLSVALLIIILLSIVTIIYQKQIINRFITEANKQIETPIKVRDIEFSAFRFFPEMALTLTDVTILEDNTSTADTLAQAREINVLLNIFDVLRGKQKVSEVYLRNAFVYLKVDKNGKRNFDIIKASNSETADSSASDKPTFFELASIRLKNVFVEYVDLRNNYKVELSTEDMSARLRQQGAKTLIQVKGQLLSKDIEIDGYHYFKYKNLLIESDLNWDQSLELLTINEADLNIDNGKFDIKGTISLQQSPIYDLSIEGINTNVNTITSLLPEQYAGYLKNYRSKGDVFFNGTVKGESSSKVNPLVDLNFGFDQVRLYHPKYRKAIEKASFQGTFTNGKKRNFETSLLSIEGFTCELDKKLIQGGFMIKDFNRYITNVQLKGQIDVNSLLEVFPDSKVSKGYGSIDADINWSGTLTNGDMAQAFKASGEILLHNVSFVLKGERLPFNSFGGSFIFRNRDLAISNFKGQVGSSDFLINGFLKDLGAALRSDNRKVVLEADLKSFHLNFDELLKSNFASIDTVSSPGSGNEYNFSINPRIDINFNCEVKHLRFQKFNGNELKGHMYVKNQIAIFDNVRFNSMGGQIELGGSVNARKSGSIEVLSDSNLKGINVDSIFYVFNNFSQDFIVDKNLKGQISAEVSTFMKFDEHLILNTQSIQANIKAVVRNGELIKFEPLQRLSKFVEAESLAHMRFSEMHNNIRISDSKVYIPEMEIFSNVTHIKVSGTHTFDQHIDYRVSVPLKKFIRLRKVADKEIDTDASGTRIFLKAVGTTSNYTISYDAAAVKEKIKQDVKKEGRELREVFQQKRSSEPEPLEVEEEEFFEF